ncbi:hypothetical protein ACW0KB_07340 [Virgibacillus salarius]
MGYLFYTNVENVVYKDFFFGEATSNEQLSIDQGIEKAKEQYQGYDMTKLFLILLSQPHLESIQLMISSRIQHHYGVIICKT